MNDTTEKLVDLCARLREAVLPSLGLRAARDHAGVAVGGDVTFAIDEVAETLLGEPWQGDGLAGAGQTLAPEMIWNRVLMSLETSLRTLAAD